MATTSNWFSTFITIGYSAYLTAILIKSHKFIFQIFGIFSPVKNESEVISLKYEFDDKYNQ